MPKNRTDGFRSKPLAPKNFVELKAKTNIVADSFFMPVEDAPKFGQLYPNNVGATLPEFNYPFIKMPAKRAISI
jgi:hypothetical protein